MAGLIELKWYFWKFVKKKMKKKSYPANSLISQITNHMQNYAGKLSLISFLLSMKGNLHIHQI